MEEAQQQYQREKAQLLELVSHRTVAVEELRETREALSEAIKEQEKLRMELENRAPPETREELKRTKLALEETRSRLARLLLNKGALESALKRISRVGDKQQSREEEFFGGNSPLSDGRRRRTIVPGQSLPRNFLKKETKHKSTTELFRPQGADDEIVKEENAIIERMMTLERSMKDASFQRDRFEQLFKIARKETKDMQVELFFSLCLSIKMSLFAQELPCNCNVQDLYEQMMENKWPVSEWPGKIYAAM
jgi:hypothetical protein